MESDEALLLTHSEYQASLENGLFLNRLHKLKKILIESKPKCTKSQIDID